MKTAHPDQAYFLRSDQIRCFPKGSDKIKYGSDHIKIKSNQIRSGSDQIRKYQVWSDQMVKVKLPIALKNLNEIRWPPPRGFSWSWEPWRPCQVYPNVEFLSIVGVNYVLHFWSDTAYMGQVATKWVFWGRWVFCMTVRHALTWIGFGCSRFGIPKEIFC